VQQETARGLFSFRPQMPARARPGHSVGFSHTAQRFAMSFQNKALPLNVFMGEDSPAGRPPCFGCLFRQLNN